MVNLTNTEEIKTVKKAIDKAVEKGWEESDKFDIQKYNVRWKLPELLFNHSFCKAFFGTAWAWYHQEMVLSTDKLEYIERYL